MHRKSIVEHFWIRGDCLGVSESAFVEVFEDLDAERGL